MYTQIRVNSPPIVNESETEIHAKCLNDDDDADGGVFFCDYRSCAHEQRQHKRKLIEEISGNERKFESCHNSDLCLFGYV